MKVLKNNYSITETVKTETIKQTYPRKLICEECGSELEYMKPDMRMGAMGCMYVDCPLCGYGNLLDDNEYNIDLTTDNIEFPIHFWHTSKETGALDRCNTDEIRHDLKRAIEYFRKNKNEYDWHTWSGNLYVQVHRYEGDEIYDVVISNDFYSVDIPFEDADY
jgi:hypothetical protein